MASRAPRVAQVSIGAADKMSPERATRTAHVDVDKIPIWKAQKPSKESVKMDSFTHKEEKRDPGHIPSLPNHAAAIAKKTKSFTPRPIDDINKVQPALQQLFKEERDQPDPLAPTKEEYDSGYLQPQQPQMPMGMPPQGQGMPMGMQPGGSPRGGPAMPMKKQMVQGNTGKTLSEMI